MRPDRTIPVCRAAELVPVAADGGDAGDDLYSTLNRVQENLLRGGLSRRSSSGRLVRTRRITSIKQDVRINSSLWDVAEEMLAA